ncbi:MAG: ATP-binding protein [Desulfobacterota bacterium]|nr:ATP-binding protein [Thermodesulfobacteriota bacterium]
MYLSLRTTVLWNMLILMLVAIALISIVTVRITYREIMRQSTASATASFAAVQAAIVGLYASDPAMVEPSYPASATLLSELIRSGAYQAALLVDSRSAVIATTGAETVGAVTADEEVRQALATRSIVTTVQAKDHDHAPSLAIAGPVFVHGTCAGAVKVIVSLKAAAERSRAAARMIVFYTCLNALILVGVGYFLMTRSIVSPLKKLTRLTENIAAGDPGKLPLFLSEQNEIGKLATAMRTMTENLMRERDALQEQARMLAEKNAQLEQAHRELLQAEKLAAVGRLSAGIAHEIGNPISIMLGYLHMLQSCSLSIQEQQEYIARIQKETERVHEIIGNLLAFSQPERGTVQSCNLNDIIRDVCTFVAGKRDLHNVSFKVDLAENLPPVLSYEQLLRQMIMNLVLNALDAMPDGGTLHITTRSTEPASVVLTVTDTGVGIPQEHLDKIFDPFFTTKQKGSGTGLGLTNVHRIVALSGGHITVSSTPGSETTFTITLPVFSPAGQKG